MFQELIVQLQSAYKGLDPTQKRRVYRYLGIFNPVSRRNKGKELFEEMDSGGLPNRISKRAFNRLLEQIVDVLCLKVGHVSGDAPEMKKLRSAKYQFASGIYEERGVPELAALLAHKSREHYSWSEQLRDLVHERTEELNMPDFRPKEELESIDRELFYLESRIIGSFIRERFSDLCEDPDLAGALLEMARRRHEVCGQGPMSGSKSLAKLSIQVLRNISPMLVLPFDQDQISSGSPRYETGSLEHDLLRLDLLFALWKQADHGAVYPAIQEKFDLQCAQQSLLVLAIQVRSGTSVPEISRLCSGLRKKTRYHRYFSTALNNLAHGRKEIFDLTNVSRFWKVDKRLGELIVLSLKWDFEQLEYRLDSYRKFVERSGGALSDFGIFRKAYHFFSQLIRSGEFPVRGSYIPLFCSERTSFLSAIGTRYPYILSNAGLLIFCSAFFSARLHALKVVSPSVSHE